MVQNDPTYIKVNLSDALSENFHQIKEFYGLKKNSALMRLIIRNEFNRLFGEPQESRLTEEVMVVE